MTNSLTVIARVLSDTLIFLQQKCYSNVFGKIYISMYFPYSKTEMLTTR